ncbi:NAD-dependent epimerase/dehydratase family protein [Streptomyces sp. NPDC059002]|uniref:NAD-dependent epimerase/dehydratase family protein n=1 Tax=Streptomyces sp. NPDC059002 TaxID=3346690 RepID=UPI0036ACEB84
MTTLNAPDLNAAELTAANATAPGLTTANATAPATHVPGVTAPDVTVDVIGGGFIALQARRHFGARPDIPYATLVAAGVSDTSETSPECFRREELLVRRTAQRCREHGRLLVFLSSAAGGLYGREGEGREDGAPAPFSAYGRHKLAMERLVADSGARWLTLRLSHLVGTQQNARQLVPSLVRQIRSGEVAVHRGARRDLLDVRHFLVVLDRLLALGVHGRVVNVASGTAVPAERLVAGVEERLGCRARRRFHDVPPETLRVSTRLMCSLVPESREFGLGPDYPDELLDRYVRGRGTSGGGDA